MSYDNRYPTTAPKNFPSSDQSDVAKTENGNQPWVSHPNPEETFSDPRRWQSIAPSSYQVNGSGEIVSGSAPQNGRVPDNSPKKSESTLRQIDNPITDNGVLYELVDSQHKIISSDGSSNYNVGEMQDSMRKGLSGKGTSEKTYSELESVFNHGTGNE